MINEIDYKILICAYPSGFEYKLDETKNEFRSPTFNIPYTYKKQMTYLTRSFNPCFIKSIKRLKDGAIFTIGDQIGNKDFDVVYNVIPFQILSIEMGVGFVKLKGNQQSVLLQDATFLLKNSEKTQIKEEQPIKISKNVKKVEEYIDKDNNIYTLSEDETYYSIVGQMSRFSENALKLFCTPYDETKDGKKSKTTKKDKEMKVSVKAGKVRPIKIGDLVYNKKSKYIGILAGNGNVGAIAKIFVLHVENPKNHTTIAPFKYLDTNPLDCELFEGEIILNNDK